MSSDMHPTPSVPPGEVEALARELWEWFDGEYGHGIANGYWPGMTALWERGRALFGSKWKK